MKSTKKEKKQYKKAFQEAMARELREHKSSFIVFSILRILVLVVLGGGGAFAYIKFIRPKQATKASADPDDYDFADEEEYINEDEPEQEEETEDTK